MSKRRNAESWTSCRERRTWLLDSFPITQTGLKLSCWYSTSLTFLYTTLQLIGDKLLFEYVILLRHDASSFWTFKSSTTDIDCSSGQFKSAKLKNKEYTVNAPSFNPTLKKEKDWHTKSVTFVGRWSAVDLCRRCCISLY